jgi:phosphate transport system permease protein
MSRAVQSTPAGASESSGRPPDLVSPRRGRRLATDRIAQRVVTLGGLAIIASIVAIFVVIAAEVWPMFRQPSAAPGEPVQAAGISDTIAVFTDEYRELACMVSPSGVRFISLKDGGAVTAAALSGLDGATIASTSAVSGGTFALGLSDGRVLPVRVSFAAEFGEHDRRVVPDLVVGEPLKIDLDGRPIKAISHVNRDAGHNIVAAVAPNRLAIVMVEEKKSLVGPRTKQETCFEVSLPVEGEIAALVADARGEDVFAGTSSGELVWVSLRGKGEPMVSRPVFGPERPGVGVTVMGFLLGDRTLVVGDAAGGVSTWQLLADDQTKELTQVGRFAAHDGPVVAWAPSQRDKGFATADAAGRVHLNYGTTGRTLLELDAPTRPTAITITPKSDGLVAVDAAGRLSRWTLANPHPEITWRALFGRLWYEGYGEPDFVWQSTGGTDDFEAKLCLTPLVFGTLKGTFYALILAVPLALFAAIYASQFMHPSLKAVVKPTVEIMAALPSVVLGFIAGLWLAPTLEVFVPGVFLLPVVVPVLILLACALWQLIPQTVRGRIRPGLEIVLLMPLVVAGGWLAFKLGAVVEHLCLGGDYRGWLLSALGLTFDQRNSLVVGMAMGFAVIPIIFTIAEDSLSNVPRHLTAGSLALGATRWQTAVRVVLPTASPGIFSAIMIGFGRAVGETMIVLMATGNTPLMDLSIFNGFRALSANIAVELPEAPEGGTLFRVLFLAALLLFVMTFLINTVAELVRLRLRHRYRYL